MSFRQSALIYATRFSVISAFCASKRPYRSPILSLQSRQVAAAAFVRARRTSLQRLQAQSVELFHFMYKNLLSSQVCCSSPQRPFITPAEQATLYRGYFTLIDLVRHSRSAIHFFYGIQADYALFGWVRFAFAFALAVLIERRRRFADHRQL